MHGESSEGLGFTPTERGPIINGPPPLRPFAFSRGDWFFVVAMIGYHAYMTLLMVLDSSLKPVMAPMVAMSATSLPLIGGFFMIRSRLAALPPSMTRFPGPTRGEIPGVLLEHYLPRFMVALFPAAVCYGLMVLGLVWHHGTDLLNVGDWRWWVLWVGSLGPFLLFTFLAVRAIGVEMATLGEWVFWLLSFKWTLLFWAVFLMPVFLAMPAGTSFHERHRAQTGRSSASEAIQDLDERYLFIISAFFIVVSWGLVVGAIRQLLKEFREAPI